MWIKAKATLSEILLKVFSGKRLKSLLELKNDHEEKFTVPFDIRLKIKDLV